MDPGTNNNNNQNDPEPTEELIPLMSIDEAKAQIQDPNSDSWAKYNALYHLRTHATPEVGQILIDSYPNLGTSSLLRHEVMYIMGQMRLPSSYPFLKAKMNDPEELPVVRHEAGEALANYHHMKEECLTEMQKHWDSPVELLKSTVRVGIHKLNNYKSDTESRYGKKYGGTIEPAEPFNEVELREFLKIAQDDQEADLVALAREKLLSSYEEVDEYPKYRICYYLRDLNSKESKRVLAELMWKENREFISALLRHEVSFILGQIYESDKYIVDTLKQVCYDDTEHPVVRHEAILAFWEIAKDEELVERLKAHKDQLVRESVVCAIRMAGGC